MINCNQAAGSFPKAPGVAKAVAAFLTDAAYNVERGTMVTGAVDIVFQTRRLLADFFGCHVSKHLVFTSGITTALNTLIFAWLKPGDHVLCTSLEHNAVLRPLHAGQAMGIEHDVVMANKQGVIDLNKMEALVRPATRAVIVTTASNVCGAYTPLAHKSLGTFPHGTVRFSFGYFNTKEEIDTALEAVSDILKLSP